MRIDGSLNAYSLLYDWNRSDSRLNDALDRLTNGCLGDLPEAWADLILARTQQQVSIFAFKTRMQMQKDLLDILV